MTSRASVSAMESVRSSIPQVWPITWMVSLGIEAMRNQNEQLGLGSLLGVWHQVQRAASNEEREDGGFAE